MDDFIWPMATGPASSGTKYLARFLATSPDIPEVQHWNPDWPLKEMDIPTDPKDRHPTHVIIVTRDKHPNVMSMVWYGHAENYVDGVQRRAAALDFLQEPFKPPWTESQIPTLRIKYQEFKADLSVMRKVAQFLDIPIWRPNLPFLDQDEKWKDVPPCVAARSPF